MKINVVAAIIQKDQRFLLGKRSLYKKSSPGFWSPISGKIEVGETENEAVERECFEEVGLIALAVRKVTEFDIDAGKARLHWWLVNVMSGQEHLRNDEHSDLRWFSTAEMRQEKDINSHDIDVFEGLNF